MNLHVGNKPESDGLEELEGTLVALPNDATNASHAPAAELLDHGAGEGDSRPQAPLALRMDTQR